MANQTKDKSSTGNNQSVSPDHEPPNSNDQIIPELKPFSKNSSNTVRAKFHPDVPSGKGAPSNPSNVLSSPTGHHGPIGIDAQHLLIGREIHLKGGKITSCTRLTLDGQVEDSSLIGAKALEVSTVGIFKGKADVDEAIIAGKFEGTLTARSRLVVNKTGSINGKVTYGSIVIEPGGQISGEMNSISDQS